MKASELTVGTVYLVNRSNDWKTDTYGTKAYRLMSLDRMAQQKRYIFAQDVKAEVEFDGVTYAHGGRTWRSQSDGPAMYLMLEVDPKTGESANVRDSGKPFLALVKAREIRGEWATAAAESLAIRKAEGEAERLRAQGARESMDRATSSVQRFKALLGIEGEYSSRVKIDTFYSSNRVWGQGVSFQTKDAEVVLTRLETAEARVIALEAELAVLRSQA